MWSGAEAARIWRYGWDAAAHDYPAPVADNCRDSPAGATSSSAHFGDPHHYHLPFFGIYAGFRYEQTVEESMKAAEEPLASLGLFYQGGGANATMMTPCTVEQMMVALPEQTSFDCESQWNALAAAAQQGQQETQAKPLWSQLTSCESPPTEPELETCVGEHGSVDTATVPFADEQQFKKQKVKDAPVLSLPTRRHPSGFLAATRTPHTARSPAAHLAPSKALLSQTAGRREGRQPWVTRESPRSPRCHR
ncbi:hypothetical protein HPB47_018326, partial [Ixodes persulcatus]